MTFGHVGRWKGVTHCVSVIRSRPLPGQGRVSTPQTLSDPKQANVPKKGVNNWGRPLGLQYIYIYIDPPTVARNYAAGLQTALKFGFVARADLRARGVRISVNS